MVRSYWIVLAGTLMLAACDRDSTELVAPAVTVQQLMAKSVQPTAEIYWGAVQYISDETGNHDIVPKPMKTGKKPVWPPSRSANWARNWPVRPMPQDAAKTGCCSPIR